MLLVNFFPFYSSTFALPVQYLLLLGRFSKLRGSTTRRLALCQRTLVTSTFTFTFTFRSDAGHVARCACAAAGRTWRTPLGPLVAGSSSDIARQGESPQRGRGAQPHPGHRPPRSRGVRGQGRTAPRRPSPPPTTQGKGHAEVKLGSGWGHAWLTLSAKRALVLLPFPVIN